MAAFGAPQGGKASAHESKPKQGHNPSTTESPKGDVAKPIVPKGVGGSKRGFNG